MRRAAIAAAIFFAAILPSRAHAFGAGVFGYSGKPPAESCNQCHSGGTAPTVTLTGPATLAAGETATYAVDIVTGASSAKVGFDLASDGGELGVIAAQTNESWLNSGEITHTKNWPAGKEVRLMFNLTAPAQTGPLTIYATALNTDGIDNTTGDLAASTTFAVAVTTGGPPLDLSMDAISQATEKPTAQDLGPPMDEARWACSFGEGAAASGSALIAAALLALALRRRRAR